MDATPVLSTKRLSNLDEPIATRIWPYVLGGFLIFIPLLIQIVVRRETLWDNCYLPAARELWEGRDPFDAKTTYVYPPLMAWLCTPFLSWPLGLSRAAIYLINVGMVVFVVWAAWRLAGGKSLHSRREHGIFLLGMASGFLYLFNCLSYPQSDIFIAALMFGGCLLFAKDRPLWAATLWGVAAGAKCTPLLWLAYLVWRKQWRAALWLPVVAVCVNLLPELTHPAPHGTWLSIWFERFIAPLADANRGIGEWYSLLLYNQSIQGTVARLFLFDPFWDGGNLSQTPRLGTLSPTLVKKMVLVGEIVLLGICFLTMRFGLRKPERADARTPRLAFEMSVVMILMLLLSPMSSKYHFGLLILPGFALAREVQQSGRRAEAWLFGLSLVGVAFASKTPWGTTIYSYSLWHSVTFWQTALILTGCLVTLRRVPARAQCALPADAPQPRASAA